MIEGRSHSQRIGLVLGALLFLGVITTWSDPNSAQFLDHRTSG